MPLTFERLAVIGMGDADKKLRPLSQCAAIEIDGAKLGHHIVHVGPGRDDAGTLFEAHLDARGTGLRGRREGEDGLTSLR